MRTPPFIQPDNTPISPRNLICPPPDSNGNINFIGHEVVTLTEDATILPEWHGRLIVGGTNASAPTVVTVPTGLPDGFWCLWAQLVDEIEFDQDIGVTLSSLGDDRLSEGIGAFGRLDWVEADSFVLSGNLTT